MSIDPNLVKSKLSSLSSGFAAVQSAAAEKVNQSTAIQQSQLGRQVGHSIDGIESITEEITEVLPVVDGTLKDVNVGQTLGEFVVSKDSIFGTFQSVGSTLGAALGRFTGTFDSIAGSLGGALGSISNIVSNTLSSITNAASAALSSLTSPIGTLSSAASNLFGSLGSGPAAALSQPTATAVQEVDDFNALMSGRSFTRIREDSPLADLIKQNRGMTNPVAPYAADIELMLGESVTEAFNAEVTIGPSPQALSNGLQAYASIPPQQIMGTLQNVTTPEYASLIPQSIELDFVSDFQGKISGFLSNLNDALSGGFLGRIRNLVDDISGQVNSVINEFVDLGNLSDDALANVRSALERNSVVDAADIILQINPQAERAILEQRLGRIDTTIAGNLAPASSSTVAPRVVGGSASSAPVGTTSSRPTTAGSTTTAAPTFAFVDSYEELVAEFRAATREITEVVVHWTANFINQSHIGAEDIHRIHLERGFNEIGYHYVIKRDGSIQRGRNIDKVGAHALANGHNNFSIGVGFVAGYNCVSGTPNPNRYISADSISAQQMETFNSFMRAFYEAWPYGQAWGHVDTDDQGKVDPGFSVADYVRNNFNKFNVSASGQQPPLSRAQLVGTATPVASSSQISRDSRRPGPQERTEPLLGPR